MGGAVEPSLSGAGEVFACIRVSTLAGKSSGLLDTPSEDQVYCGNGYSNSRSPQTPMWSEGHRE